MVIRVQHEFQRGGHKCSDHPMFSGWAEYDLVIIIRQDKHAKQLFSICGGKYKRRCDSLVEAMVQSPRVDETLVSGRLDVKMLSGTRSTGLE